MSEKYKVHSNDYPYFITMTIIDWVDLFTRKEHKNVIISSLKYCQEHKGLIIHAYVIMPSHIHMIVSSKQGHHLPEIIRDFKKFTSRQLIKSIQECGESRREWLLNKFSFAANRIKRNNNFKVWKDGFHPVELSNNKMISQRLNYIHENPVKDGIVTSSNSYLYSSAVNFGERGGMLSISPV